MIDNVDMIVFHVYIKCDDSPRFDNCHAKLSYRDLPFFVRMKYDWYFNYRAALLQVKYPRAYVRIDVVRATPNTKRQIDVLKQRVSAAQGQVTKIENLLTKARDHWNSLFPIEDDHLYKRAMSKLAQKQELLTQAIQDFETFKPWWNPLP